MAHLNTSEAVYGFAAWLTTRTEVICVGSSQDSAPVAELVKKFCEHNSLEPISDDWPKDNLFPEEDIRKQSIRFATSCDNCGDSVEISEEQYNADTILCNLCLEIQGA